MILTDSQIRKYRDQEIWAGFWKIHVEFQILNPQNKKCKTCVSKYNALTRNSIRERSIWVWTCVIIQNFWKSTKTCRQKIIDFCLNFGQLQLDLASSSEGVRNFRWTFWKAVIFLFRLLWFLFHFRNFWKTRGYA